MSAHGAGSVPSGRFIPEMWSAKLASAFAKAVVFGSSVNYMYGPSPETEYQELCEMDPQHELWQIWEDFYCKHGRWEKAFAWLPKSTERGKVWLRPVMKATYTNRGDKFDMLYLTVPGYVAYRLDGKIGG